MTLPTHNPKDLKPNPWNTNRVSPDNMTKLKRSITDLGFTSAVVVRELPDGSLEILGGHHRCEAAIELGIKAVPILNLGVISDAKAKKIGLVDNSRYGVDDTIALAKLLEDMGVSSAEMAEFLPFTEADFDTVQRAVQVNLDELEFMDPDEDDGPADDDMGERQRPQKTHEVLRFRVGLGEAERIRQLIEKTIKREGLDDSDELTAAGSALALLLFNQ
jgi:ParB family chromosome partitioning protein